MRTLIRRIVVCATACSAGTDEEPSVKNQIYVSDLPPHGGPSFTRGEGIIGGTRYAHSLLWSCKDCLPIGEAGQQGQPGMEFTVPAGLRRLEFIAGLTDSSSVTDRSAYVGVWAQTADELTRRFESSDVTVGVGMPVTVPGTPGNKIRIDGGHLNGNEILCACDPKLVP